MAVKFPSVEFFGELATRMNAERPTFEKLGFCDIVLGMRVVGKTSHLYALTYEVFECADVRELRDASEAELACTLEAPAALWREMIESIQKNGLALPEYTLNSLSHIGDRMKVIYDDPEGHDKFYRFMATLQEYINLTHDLDIEWA